eukprot:gene9638-10625_t
MVLSDYLRVLISKLTGSDNAKSDVGVTGLPRDIEDDLLKNRPSHSEHHPGQDNQQHYHECWQWPGQGEGQNGFPNFSIYIGPEDESHYDDEFVQIEQNMMAELQRMMGGLFGGFGVGGEHDFVHNFPPQLQGPEIPQHRNEKEDKQDSLRDKMFHRKNDQQPFSDYQVIPFQHGYTEEKRPSPHSMMDWAWTFPFGNNRQKTNTGEFKDRDFDSEVESGSSKLSDIIDQEGSEKQAGVIKRPTTDGFSFQKFSSITTKKLADGTVESQKTVRDSEGNEEITVIRKLGDQEHKKIIKKDKSGNEQTNENLINMDEGDLEKFEDAWTRTQRKGQWFQPADKNSDSSVDNFASGHFKDSLRDFFFPWKRN